METSGIIDNCDKLSKRSDKGGEKLKSKSKKEDDADHSSIKIEESEKNKNNNDVSDISSSNVSEARNSLNSQHAKTTDQCTASNGEQIIEIKTHSLKEDKSTNKKKTQKEDANGRGKEDCEKKKRKKKKKKKGACCEDDSSKLARDGETSKDRLIGKNGVSKADNTSKDIVKKEQRIESIEETTGDAEKELPSIANKDETSDANVEEHAKETCNKRNHDNALAAVEADGSEFKTNEEDIINDCLIDAQSAPDTAGAHQEPDAGDTSGETNVAGQKELPTEMQNVQEAVKLDNNDIPHKATISTESTSADQHVIRDEDSAKVTVLDTIIESDETIVTAEEGENESCQDVGERGQVHPAGVGAVKDTTGQVHPVGVGAVKDTTGQVHPAGVGAVKDNTGQVHPAGVGAVKDTIDHACRTAGADVSADIDTDIDTLDGGDRESSGTNMTHEQLQQKLQEQYQVMASLQTETQTQQIKANMLTATLQAKLRGKDKEIRLLKCEHEQHMSAVLSHLLYLEGQLQKEQNHILEMLHEKDDIIRRQKAAIEDLVAKNNRYLQALKESHGYSLDNGFVKPQGHAVQESGNISIQDHGNKVILRGNKNKPEKIQASGHKVRFSAMKDRLRRHKSSLELYRHEKLETLMEAPKYGSEENLVGRFGKSDLLDRKERCRSLIDYPVSLFDVEEGLTESPDSCFSEDNNTPTISRNDSTSSLVTFNEKTTWNASTYGFNELSKSRSVPHALPTVSENDVTPVHIRGRPHSLPSVEMLPKDIVSKPTSDKPPAATPEISSPATPSSSTAAPSSDSNPFKTFKNVFKRKGSKKKRTASMTSGKDQTDALKQHFKKYDMT